MAIYEYRCSSCGDESEEEFPIGTARPIGVCACGGPKRRLFRTVNIAPSALETKGAVVRSQNAKEQNMAKDHPAYYRMRKRGLQPEHVGGSHRLEDQVESQVDIDYQRPLANGVDRSELVDALSESEEVRAMVESS